MPANPATLEIVDGLNKARSRVALVQSALRAISDGSAHDRAADGADDVLETVIEEMDRLAAAIRGEAA